MKAKLDAFVLDIEFLLISVVQGVALAALAGSAVVPISNFQFEYWPYIATAFIFILIFWSQAIIHALSFIDWPLNLGHTFLYFLASFVEVMTFSQIQNPLKWFEFVFAFFVVAAFLYIHDLQLIKAHKPLFQDTPKRQTLYANILSDHLFELRVLVPAGFIFNFVALSLIRLLPEVFIGYHYHLMLILVQTIFSIVTLVHSMKSFKRRTRLISASYQL